MPVFADVASQKDRDLPEVPDNLWTKINRAASWESGFNQENLFRTQYYESAQNFYVENVDTSAWGRAVLQLYQRWESVAEKFTRWVLSDDPDNPLDAVLDEDPEGAGEAYVRALRPDTFGNAQYSQTVAAGDSGQFNIIPDETQADASTETAGTNTQAWMIFGWQELAQVNEVAYDYLQADINDNIGVRREEYLRNAMQGQDTLKIAERVRGPLFVEPGFTLDVDVNVVTAGIEVGLWPIGIEIIRADDANFGGVLG